MRIFKCRAQLKLKLTSNLILPKTINGPSYPNRKLSDEPINGPNVAPIAPDTSIIDIGFVILPL